MTSNILDIASLIGLTTGFICLIFLLAVIEVIAFALLDQRYQEQRIKTIKNIHNTNKLKFKNHEH